MENYFNLIEYDLSKLKIIKNTFDCILQDLDWKSYKWFILSISKNKKSYTICDVNFHIWSDWKYTPRLTFRKTNENLQNKAVERNNEFKIIKFDRSEDWYKEFWQMIWFLSSFKDIIDLWEFNNQFSIISTDDFIVWFKDKVTADKIIDINKIINSSELTWLEIENLSKNIVYKKRIESLSIFEKMLWLKKDDTWKIITNEEDNKWSNYIAEYKKENNLTQKWEEIAWHHFLKNNSWIIWLNVDLKFINNFVDEADVWVKDINWQWSPKVDIVWYSDYTILIELKTANKDIFTENKKSTARTNTWSFSDDFLDWISQCLAQKSEHDKERKQIKKENKDWKYETLREIRTVDTDCIFIIWNKEREFSLKSTLDEDDIKKDTFKRFRENSKNIKIITFDELYQRALNILNLD